MDFETAYNQVFDNYVLYLGSGNRGYCLTWCGKTTYQDIKLSIRFYSVAKEAEMQTTVTLEIGNKKLYKFNGLFVEYPLVDFMPLTIISHAHSVLETEERVEYLDLLQAIICEIELVGSYSLVTKEDLEKALVIIEKSRFNMLGSFYYLGHHNGRKRAFIKLDIHTKDINSLTKENPDALLMAYMQDDTINSNVYFVVIDLYKNDDSWKEQFDKNSILDAIVDNYKNKAAAQNDLNTIYRKFKVDSILADLE